MVILETWGYNPLLMCGDGRIESTALAGMGLERFFLW